MTKWECIDKYKPTLIINAMEDLGVVRKGSSFGMYAIYDNLTDKNVKTVVRKIEENGA